MPSLSEYCLPFVKTGGIFAAMKGPNEDAGNAENAVKILGGEKIRVYDYLLGKDDRRKIFYVKKISHIPDKISKKWRSDKKQTIVKLNKCDVNSAFISVKSGIFCMEIISFIIYNNFRGIRTSM